MDVPSCASMELLINLDESKRDGEIQRMRDIDRILGNSNCNTERWQWKNVSDRLLLAGKNPGIPTVNIVLLKPDLFGIYLQSREKERKKYLNK